MIKFSDYIQEGYIGLVGVRGHEAFINPTKKELESIGQYVRFFINFKKKVIVTWNANTIHICSLDNKDILNALGMKSIKDWNNNRDMFSGHGTIRNGKIDSVDSDGMGTYLNQYKKYYEELNSEWTKVWFSKPLTDLILTAAAGYGL